MLRNGWVCKADPRMHDGPYATPMQQTLYRDPITSPPKPPPPPKRPAQPAHGGPDPTATGLLRPRRPLRYPPLHPHALDDSLQRRLDDDPSNDDLGEGRVQRLEVEDEVELAHVLEHAVEGLDKDLDQVQQGERGLGGGGDDDEAEGRIVAVGDEGGGVVVAGGGGRGGAGEEGREAGLCERGERRR